MFMWISIIFSLVITHVYADDKVYSFGISPQKSATELAKTWTPILSYLSEKSGITIRFSTAQSSAEFSDQLKHGKYDFCYVNPQQYTLLHQDAGYTAFAKQKDHLLQGIIVVNKNSGITKLTELKDQKLAFPSPTSFGASILPQAELKQMGIAIIPEYVKSHDSVYLNVAKNRYIAGGGVLRTFELLSPELKEQLTIIMTTQNYTPHAIASHSTVDIKVQEKVLDAMLNMSNDPQGLQLLDAIGFSGLTSAKDSDWDSVRTLDLTPVE